MSKTEPTAARSGRAIVRYQCLQCGIAAPAPIVVPLGKQKHGRCANRAACELRCRRIANRAKAQGRSNEPVSV